MRDAAKTLNFPWPTCSASPFTAAWRAMRMSMTERLSQDPAFRLIGSEKVWDRGVALTSRLQTFETEMLAEEENFAGLARINRALIGKVEALDSPQRVVLDMDSTEIPVYGEQEKGASNGHFESTCYHPLLLF